MAHKPTPALPLTGSAMSGIEEQQAQDKADRAAMIAQSRKGRSGRFSTKAERARLARADQANREIRKEQDKRERRTARLEAKGVTVTTDRTLKPIEPSYPAQILPAAATPPTLADTRQDQATSVLLTLSAMEAGWIRGSQWEDLPLQPQIVILEALSLSDDLPRDVLSLSLARAKTLKATVGPADRLKLQAVEHRLRDIQREDRPRKK